MEFAIGSSIVRVCDFCRTAVARTDRDVENLGKVADLIETGSVLRRDLIGSYRGVSFRLTGRTQLRHESGAVWDEWYAAFDDGRWGWISEYDGKYSISFEAGATSSVPAEGTLEPGASVEALESMIVGEVGHAEVISEEGELPWRAIPGTSYPYADLSGADGRYATIDYSESPPRIYKGREVRLDALGIKVEPRATGRVAAAAMNCTGCGAPIEILVPDRTEHVACSRCGGIHDVTEGKLRFLTSQKRARIDPLIPLGTRGKLDDEEWVVAGFMQRSGKDQGETWSWTEYLLYSPKAGYAYLVNDGGHWSISKPVAVGSVSDSEGGKQVGKIVHYEGRRFRLFESSSARVSYVMGEFPWKVAVGETVLASDYIAPPYGISKEFSTGKRGAEVEYSHARYLTPGEVQQAFATKDLPLPTGAGAMQPNPRALLIGEWIVACVLLIVVAIAVRGYAPNRMLFRDRVDFSGRTDWVKSITTPTLTLEERRNVGFRAQSNVSNAWAVAVAHIIPEGETDPIEVVEIPIEYYYGQDSDGSWTEGNQQEKKYVGALPGGRYTIRFDVDWDPAASAPWIEVEVRQGVFRFSHLLLAFIAISILPLISLLRWSSFETKRWEDSDFSPYKSSESDDDDEE